MNAKLKTKLKVTVKAGTNGDEFTSEEALQEWLRQKLLEFEVKTNGETMVRIHIEE